MVSLQMCKYKTALELHVKSDFLENVYTRICNSIVCYCLTYAVQYMLLLFWLALLDHRYSINIYLASDSTKNTLSMTLQVYKC